MKRHTKHIDGPPSCSFLSQSKPRSDILLCMSFNRKLCVAHPETVSPAPIWQDAMRRSSCQLSRSHHVALALPIWQGHCRRLMPRALLTCQCSAHRLPSGNKHLCNCADFGTRSGSS